MNIRRRPKNQPTPAAKSSAGRGVGALPPEVRTAGHAGRWRGRLVGALRLAWGVLLVVGAGIGVVYGVTRYATSSPRFALRRIELVGAHRTTDAAVRSLGGVQLGQNVFSIDRERCEKGLLTNPWIRDVKVERRLPATLRVEVTERQVAALAVFGNELVLISKMGEPFKTWEPGDPSDLPVVTGVSVANMARDKARESERVLRGLEVIRQYERLALSRVHAAEEVHLAPSGDVVLTVGKQGMLLHLGRGPWAKKLSMAERVLTRLPGKSKSASDVFLDNRAHPERVVVRMR